ncbi:MAG: hypothetical protein NC254_05045 [bacterium]|nr:hypothetical protein [bacterium]
MFFSTKKGRIHSLLFSAAVLFLFTTPLPANAEIIGEKESFPDSIITDMGMLPAARLSTSDVYYANPTNAYQELKVAAQYTRQGEYYFIVDTYHDQILYSETAGGSIQDWKVMTVDVNKPHAVASDGEKYLVADTDNHRVLVFEWLSGRFQNTQCLADIGVRPHYITYDSITDSFFVWSSMTGEMYILKQDPQSGLICIQEKRTVRELSPYYVRSFTILGDQILFPSGTNGRIVVVDKDTFEVLERYPVPDEIAGMACVKLIGDSYYISVACDLFGNQECAALLRTTDLSGLSRGAYENISEQKNVSGIPYYIEMVNGFYYMTNHCAKESVLRFKITGNYIEEMKIIF